MLGGAIRILAAKSTSVMEESPPRLAAATDLQRCRRRQAAKTLDRRRSVLFSVLFGVLSAACSQPPSQSVPAAATPPPGSDYEGAAFEFHPIKDDIYLAVETGNLAIWCNAVVIVNDNDVLLVESHVSPAAAWALLRELKQITDKPVRHVVNTHFHFDHLHGNQIYGGDVEIIGHEFTRRMVLAGSSNRGRTYDYFVGDMPGQVEELEAELAAAEDPDRMAEIEQELSILRNARLALDAVVPTPPNLTLTDRMTLYRGGREIQLMFLGRGHTGGGTWLSTFPPRRCSRPVTCSPQVFPGWAMPTHRSGPRLWSTSSRWMSTSCYRHMGVPSKTSSASITGRHTYAISGLPQPGCTTRAWPPKRRHGGWTCAPMPELSRASSRSEPSWPRSSASMNCSMVVIRMACSGDRRTEE